MRHCKSLISVLLLSVACGSDPTVGASAAPGLIFIDSHMGWLTHGGLFLTDDGGKSWKLANPRQNAVAFAAVDANELWLATRTQLLWTGDRGVKWTDLTGALRKAMGAKASERSLDKIQFLSRQNGWIVAQSRGSGEAGAPLMLRTEDAGSSWTAHEILIETRGRRQGIEYFYSPTDFHFVDERTGWLVAGRTLYRSDDGGMEWGVARTLDETLPQRVFFLNRSLGWVACADGTLLITEDGGRTWADAVISRPVSSVEQVKFDADGVGWVSAREAAKKNCGDFGLVRNNLLLRTEDAGRSWNKVFEMCGRQLFWSSLNGQEAWVMIAAHSIPAALPHVAEPKGFTIFRTLNGGMSWEKIFEAK